MHRAKKLQRGQRIGGVSIRSKNRFWRAPMRREAGGHENFFVAKTRDSESVQRAFGRHRHGATTPRASRSLHA
jgi:hypothetical protein